MRERGGAGSGAETRTSERWGDSGDGAGGDEAGGVPAPHAPLYTVGGARRPLLPVLKYCSLTDMALTMGPEMRGRGGGGPLQPPDAGAHRAAPGDPRARGPGMGELRAGRLALCFGLGPGWDGAGWQCWGRGRAHGGLPGPPGGWVGGWEGGGVGRGRAGGTGSRPGVRWGLGCPQPAARLHQCIWSRIALSGQGSSPLARRGRGGDPAWTGRGGCLVWSGDGAEGGGEGVRGPPWGQGN